MNTKKIAVSLVLVLIVLLISIGAIFFYKNLRGAFPAISPPKQDISKLIKDDQLPVSIPEGFKIEIFADGLNRPRVMHIDPQGNLLVSEMDAGNITIFQDSDQNKKKDLLTGLNRPHGLESICERETCTLFVAETNVVSRYDYNPIELTATNRKEIANLPADGGHYTRTLLIHKDKLLVSIGSKCNACLEADNKRASIISMDFDGDNQEIYASGLRNSVFLKHYPNTDTIWATDNGRDLLGDNLPPDEVNLIVKGANYGWPHCYGNQVLDTTISNDFDCSKTKASHIDIQAHSAALGFDFFKGDIWPEELRGNLLVAYHGSWNRTIPTGYKIMLFQLDKNQQEQARSEFITGWLSSNNNALGRPVDIIIKDNGTILISDDHAGVIYLLTYNNLNE